MKRISLLRILITIAFILTLTGIIFGVPFTIIFAFFQDKIPHGITVNINKGHANGTITPVNLLLSITGAACSAYALYNFREALKLFEKHIFFDERVILFFRKTGIFTIYATLLFALSDTFYRDNNGVINFTAGIDIKTIVAISLGLLFFVLSDIFSMAKNQKEENELTI